MLPGIADRLEPSQDRQVRRARVVERGTGPGTAGEELLAEPGEIGDIMTPGLVGERPRVERLRDRRGTGPGSHQGHRVDPVPRQQLRGGLLGQADELPVRRRREERHEAPAEVHCLRDAVEAGRRDPRGRRRRHGDGGLAGRRRYDDRKTRGHDQEAGQDAAHGSRSDLCSWPSDPRPARSPRRARRPAVRDDPEQHLSVLDDRPGPDRCIIPHPAGDRRRNLAATDLIVQLVEG